MTIEEDSIETNFQRVLDPKLKIIKTLRESGVNEVFNNPEMNSEFNNPAIDLKSLLYARGFIFGLMDASVALDKEQFKRIVEKIYESIDTPDTQLLITNNPNAYIEIMVKIKDLNNQILEQALSRLVFALKTNANYIDFFANQGPAYDEVSKKLDLVYYYGYVYGAIHMHFLVYQDQDKYNYYLERLKQAYF